MWKKKNQIHKKFMKFLKNVKNMKICQKSQKKNAYFEFWIFLKKVSIYIFFFFGNFWPLEMIALLMPKRRVVFAQIQNNMSFCTDNNNLSMQEMTCRVFREMTKMTCRMDHLQPLKWVVLTWFFDPLTCFSIRVKFNHSYTKMNDFKS